MKSPSQKNRYENGKAKLLKDKSVCVENRDLFKEFFESMEYRLKRLRGLKELDDGNYKTLYGYVYKLKQVNNWFKNKPWKELTEADIKKVYDDLEDGVIKRGDGKPYENLETSYYGKIIKSEPFRLAGKLELAKKVIQYSNNVQKAVRFITEEDFRKLIRNVNKPIYKLLFWLAWDIGENINSLLQLKKSDFYKQSDPDTGEEEYRVNLRKAILKRSRKARSEITNHTETVELLNQLLPDYKEGEIIFPFKYEPAKMMMIRSVTKAKIKCQPNGERPSWKDLRSGMACNLLKKGYTTDEVNARLGHKPSSDEIDKYINFLALDRHKPKRKVEQFKINQLKKELERSKEREKLYSMRMENLQSDVKKIRADNVKSLEQIKNILVEAIPSMKNYEEYEKNKQIPKLIKTLKEIKKRKV